MGGQPAESSDDILADRVALLERELDWARLQDDRRRVAELRARLAELNAARHHLLREAA